MQSISDINNKKNLIKETVYPSFEEDYKSLVKKK